VLAVVCASDCIAMASEARGVGLPLAVVAALAALSLTMLWLLASRRARWVAGPVAVAGLATLEHLGERAGLSPHRNLFAAGGVLLGFVVLDLVEGLVSRRAGRPRAADDALAELGGAAVIAAVYTGAGLSKLRGAGAEWASGGTLRALVVSQVPDGLSDGALSSLRRAVVESPNLATALSVAALSIQLGALAMLVGPRARAAWGALLVGFHLGVLTLTGIGYGSALVLVAAWSFPWPRWLGRDEHARWPGAKPLAFAAGVVALMAVGALASAHPEASRSVTVAELGPVRVGDELAGGLTIARIERTEDEAVIWLSGDAAGPLKLRLRVAETGTDRGPFGAGATDLLFDERDASRLDALRPAGLELAARLREAPAAAWLDGTRGRDGGR
jgi:hypothetical protein